MKNAELALAKLVSERTEGPIEFDQIAAMKVRGLFDHGVTLNDVALIVEDECGVNLTAEERAKLSDMPLATVANLLEERMANMKLEAAAACADRRPPHD